MIRRTTSGRVIQAARMAISLGSTAGDEPPHSPQSLSQSQCLVLVWSQYPVASSCCIKPGRVALTPVLISMVCLRSLTCCSNQRSARRASLQSQQCKEAQKYSLVIMTRRTEQRQVKRFPLHRQQLFQNIASSR